MIDLARLSLKQQYIHKMNDFGWQDRKNYETFYQKYILLGNQQQSM